MKSEIFNIPMHSELFNPTQNQLGKIPFSTDDSRSQNEETLVSNLAEAEEKLMEIFKYPMTAASLLGFFPLTRFHRHRQNQNQIKNRGQGKINSLRFNWCSLISFSTILLSFCAIAASVYWSRNYNQLSKHSTVTTLTEYLSQEADGFITFFFCLFLHMFELLRGRKTVQFWRGNVQLLERMKKLGFFKNGNDEEIGENDEQKNILTKLRVDCRNAMIRHLIPLFIVSAFPLTFTIGYTIKNYGHIKTEENASEGQEESWIVTLYVSYLTYWIWVSYFHVLYKFLPITFIKFYSSCFQALSFDIQKVSQTSKGEFEIDVHKVYLKLDSYFEMINEIKCEIASFNVHFQWVLISEILLCIWKILIYSFFACLFLFNALVKSSLSPMYFIKFLPIFLDGKALYDFCSASTDLIERTKQVAEKLEDIQRTFSVDLKSRYRDKILMLHTRLMINPKGISPKGFFTLNRTVFTSLIGLLTTYLIVLVQFRDSSKEPPNFSS